MALPHFQKDVVQSKRKDGYWVETFKLNPEDKVPGLIAYGLDIGTVEFFDNPVNQTSDHGTDWVLVTDPPQPDQDGQINIDSCSQEHSIPVPHRVRSLQTSSDWKTFTIAQLDSPVAVTVADVDGNGLNDLIICYNYGKDFINCNPQGGYIAWLKNPGRPKLGQGTWALHYIGRWPAMHRLKAGYFTQRTFLELIALPVVHGPRDLSTPIPVILFQTPDKITEAWIRSIIDDTSFTIIHDACKRRFHANTDSGLESLILASREGLNWLHFSDNKWRKLFLNGGMPQTPGQQPNEQDFWGCESVDVGKVDGNSFGYIATLEAFHGTTVAVYTRDQSGLQDSTWKRHVLDVYGTPTQQSKQGSGPGHFIVTGDFDNDGNDEFLVALWGPSPKEPGPTPGASECQGVWYYKPVDLKNGVFARFKVATESAARIAVGDFRGDGRLSFATISYYVANYYKSPNPQVRVYYNDFAQLGKEGAVTQFSTAYRNNEALVCLPKPTSHTRHEVLPLLSLAGFHLELEILPPQARRKREESADAIKVLYGTVFVAQEASPRKALSVPRCSSSSSGIGYHAYQASEEGAVVIRLTTDVTTEAPSADVEDIPLRPLLKVSPSDGPQPDWKFQEVDEQKAFWNLKGFEIRFTDQTPLAHLQFWAAGPRVDCGLHNHNDAIFGEIHLSLSTGTGNGGLWWLPTTPTIGDSEFQIPEHQGSDFKQMPLQALMEHGPIWFQEPGSAKAMRRPDSTVCYPWHKWQAGDKGKGMDVWMAVEFDPLWLD